MTGWQRARAVIAIAGFLIAIGILVLNQPDSRPIIALLIIVAAICGGVLAATIKLSSEHRAGWVVGGVIITALIAWVVVPATYSSNPITTGPIADTSSSPTHSPTESPRGGAPTPSVASSPSPAGYVNAQYDHSKFYLLQVAIRNPSTVEDAVISIKLRAVIESGVRCHGATAYKFNISDNVRVDDAKKPERFTGKVSSKLRETLSQKKWEKGPIDIAFSGGISGYCGSQELNIEFDPLVALAPQALTVFELRVPKNFADRARARKIRVQDTSQVMWSVTTEFMSERQPMVLCRDDALDDERVC